MHPARGLDNEIGLHPASNHGIEIRTAIPPAPYNFSTGSYPSIFPLHPAAGDSDSGSSVFESKDRMFPAASRT
mgnify:CR=1 FL=1